MISSACLGMIGLALGAPNRKGRGIVMAIAWSGSGRKRGASVPGRGWRSRTPNARSNSRPALAMPSSATTPSSALAAQRSWSCSCAPGDTYQLGGQASKHRLNRGGDRAGSDAL